MFEQNIGIIIKVARAYTAVAQDREDLTNDIALELWKSFGSFREESRVATWMYRVALNTAMNFSRKNRRGQVVFIDDSKLQETMEWMSDQTDDDQTELLYQCIEDLNDLNKAIVLLYLDGHSYDEISTVTGISKTNVGTRMMRIRINKEILKKMVLNKPQKRITGMILKSMVELLMPIPLLIWFFSEVGIRYDWQYWVGMALFFTIATIGYYLSIKHFLLIRKVDFASPLTQTRKDLKEIELNKLSRIKFGLYAGPFGAIGVFMISRINVLSVNFILPLVLILLVFGLSHYLRYRYGVVERFRTFKQELNELEELEKS